MEETTAEIYRRRSLYASRAMKRGLTEGEASDAVSMTVEKVWRFWHTYDPTQPLDPWVSTVFINVCNTIYRRRRVQTDPFPDLEGEEYGRWEENFLEASSLDPEEVLLNDERRQAVEDCLLTLSDAHRQTLQLWREDYSHLDIATACGTNEGTVKSRLFYGLRKLKGCLEAKGIR